MSSEGISRISDTVSFIDIIVSAEKSFSVCLPVSPFNDPSAPFMCSGSFLFDAGR